MIDADVNCPTVPAPGFGTAGQSLSGWDSERDKSGTGTLKALAALVLARDSGRDKGRIKPVPVVPASPIITQPDGTGAAPAVLPSVQLLPGVPLAWGEGLALLATLPAPEGITPPRWRMFQDSAARLLRDRGAALHAVGWDVVSLFGLHQCAPATNPPGWGLAWLLGEIGEVLDVSPDAVGVRCGPNGARLAFRHRCGAARAGAVPAWAISGDGDG